MMHISSTQRARGLPLGFRLDRSTVQPVSDGPQGDRTGDDQGTYHRAPSRRIAAATSPDRGARRAGDGRFRVDTLV